MEKQALLNWLDDEYQQWNALLDLIGPARMDQPGVSGDWTMQDIVAHLTGWQRRRNAHLEAARNGEPEPPPLWPAHLQTEDEINGWILEANRTRSVRESLDASDQVLRQLLTLMEQLPDDARIEQVQHEGRTYHLVWIGDKRFQAGEFFDHYHDDHEADVRAWLERVEKA